MFGNASITAAILSLVYKRHSSCVGDAWDISEELSHMRTLGIRVEGVRFRLFFGGIISREVLIFLGRMRDEGILLSNSGSLIQITSRGLNFLSSYLALRAWENPKEFVELLNAAPKLDVPWSEFFDPVTLGADDVLAH